MSEPLRKQTGKVTRQEVEDELGYMAYLGKMGNGFVIDDTDKMDGHYGVAKIQPKLNGGRGVRTR